MRILGVSPAHDSSVAIINNGELEYFCKEERLSRVKHDSNPYTVLNHIIKNIGGVIDTAVISSPTWYMKDNDILEDFLKKSFKCDVIRLCHEHHLQHASLAFNNSGFKSSLVIVIDRQGSDYNGRMREAETVFRVDKNYNFESIYKSFWLYNTGEKFDFSNYKDLLSLRKLFPRCEVIAESTLGITKLYETATTLIGENSLENGKVMGLSAYGEKDKFKNYIRSQICAITPCKINLFNNGIPNSNLFMHFDDMDFQPILREYSPFKIENKKPLSSGFNSPEGLPGEGYELYADYALHVQTETQNEVLKLVKRYVKHTGILNVCVTGGYGFNVVSNENLVKNLPDVNFFFEPLADDSGNSIGGALMIYRSLSKDKKIHKLKDTFFNHTKENIPPVGVKVTTKEVASFLADQKIVAVYNGMAEAGPRSLGNRSILFDARNPKAKDIINSVKNREWYRPFAGSVLKEKANEYFEMYGLKDSPFMTVSFQVKEEKLEVIPGVVHVDNSCRIQTVDKDIGHYYELLKEFEYITGVPVLLNTSFNVAGDPLVETVEEAVDMFKKTKIDVLWFPEKGRMLTGA